MRLLHVVASIDPQAGGVSQAVRSLAIALDELSVESVIATLDKEGKEDSSLLVSALGPAIGPWAFSFKLSSWLCDNIVQFDVVIIHGLWLYPSICAYRVVSALARSSNLMPRLFVMPHGMLDPYFQRDPSRRLKAIRNRIYWRLIERAVVNGAQGLLFTCEQERLLARESFPGYSPRSETVVGLGVMDPPAHGAAQTEAFLRVCPELKGRPFLLFLGRIHPKKGVDLILEAYVREVTDFAWHGRPAPALVIAGPLNSSYADEMRALALQLVADFDVCNCPLIVFPGMLRGDEKWGALAHCEAFVLSSHQENFGIAVVEALASSKPVLISKEVNIWREIESAGAGFVEKDDLEGTAALLSQWFELSEEDRAEMGPRARQCYLENFQVAGAARRFLDAISTELVA